MRVVESAGRDRTCLMLARGAQLHRPPAGPPAVLWQFFLWQSDLRSDGFFHKLPGTAREVALGKEAMTCEISPREAVALAHLNSEGKTVAGSATPGFCHVHAFQVLFCHIERVATPRLAHFAGLGYLAPGVFGTADSLHFASASQLIGNGRLAARIWRERRNLLVAWPN